MNKIACEFKVSGEQHEVWTQYLPAVPAKGDLVVRGEEQFSVKAVIIRLDYNSSDSVGYGILLDRHSGSGEGD